MYNDGPFHLVRTDSGDRLAPFPGDYAFLRFVSAVGSSFDSTMLFARTRRVDELAGRRFVPDGLDYQALPYYESLFDISGLLRAIPGSVRGFWRGLGRVDAVWVLGPHPFALLLVPLAVAKKKRVVLGVRQDTTRYYRSRLRSPRWKPVLILARSWELSFRLLARRLPTVVVGDEIARQYGGRRPTLLTTSVSQIRSSELVDAPQERDWSGPITLFTASRIDREKNPLLLVEAIARLEALQPGRFRLFWAGSGPFEQDVRNRARDLGVETSIELLGHIPFGPALLDRYRDAHAFVHVSLTEGVPATLIEALGSGTPVVATAVGGVATALEHGRAGLLVPPRDVDALVSAILRLTEDAKLRDELVRYGLRLAREHTIDATSDRIARFIKGQLDGLAPRDERP